MPPIEDEHRQHHHHQHPKDNEGDVTLVNAAAAASGSVPEPTRAGYFDTALKPADDVDINKGRIDKTTVTTDTPSLATTTTATVPPEEVVAPVNVFRVDNWRWITLSAMVGVLAVVLILRAPLFGFNPFVPSPDAGPAVANFAACLSRTAPGVLDEREAEIQCHEQLANLAREQIHLHPGPHPAGPVSFDSNPLFTAGSGLVPPMTTAAGGIGAATMSMTNRGTLRIFAAVIAGFLGVIIANFNSTAMMNQILVASGLLWFVASITGPLSVIIWPQMAETLLYVWVFSTSFWIAIAVYTKVVFQYNAPRPVATALSVAACTVLAVVIRAIL